MVVQVVVVIATEQGQVVDVGTAFARTIPVHDVMGLAHRRAGRADDTPSVADLQCAHLRIGGTPRSPTVPERLASAVEHEAEQVVNFTKFF